VVVEVVDQMFQDLQILVVAVLQLPPTEVAVQVAVLIVQLVLLELLIEVAVAVQVEVDLELQIIQLAVQAVQVSL
tara:strand:- start:48 stop:272 length:225 start_codon:yes stop_codon:yes gene_type:complete